MASVEVRKNENIDSALKRFKRETAKAGTLAELRKRRHYESQVLKERKNQKLLVERRKNLSKEMTNEH